MSIQTELTRLTNAKAAIKAAIEGKGVTVPDATLLDGMASLIESIEAGGGLPSGISQIEYGTYTPTEDKKTSSVYVFASFTPDICISQAVDESIYTDTSGTFSLYPFIGGIRHNLPYNIGNYKISNSSQYRSPKGTKPLTEDMALTANASTTVFPHSQRYLFAGYTYRWVAIKFA